MARLILAFSGMLSGLGFITIGAIAIGMADIKDDLDLVRGYTEAAIRAQRAPAPLPSAPSYTPPARPAPRPEDMQRPGSYVRDDAPAPRKWPD